MHSWSGLLQYLICYNINQGFLESFFFIKGFEVLVRDIDLASIAIVLDHFGPGAGSDSSWSCLASFFCPNSNSYFIICLRNQNSYVLFHKDVWFLFLPKIRWKKYLEMSKWMQMNELSEPTPGQNDARSTSLTKSSKSFI